MYSGQFNYSVIELCFTFPIYFHLTNLTSAFLGHLASSSSGIGFHRSSLAIQNLTITTAFPLYNLNSLSLLFPMTIFQIIFKIYI